MSTIEVTLALAAVALAAGVLLGFACDVIWTFWRDSREDKLHERGGIFHG